MSDLWIHWKGMLVSEWEEESNPFIPRRSERDGIKLGKQLSKFLLLSFLCDLLRALQRREFLLFFFFCFKHIFVVSKKFAFSSLPHHRFAFSCWRVKREREKEKRKKGHWRIIKFSIVLLKHNVGSFAGRENRVLRTFCAGWECVGASNSLPTDSWMLRQLKQQVSSSSRWRVRGASIRRTHVHGGKQPFKGKMGKTVNKSFVLNFWSCVQSLTLNVTSASTFLWYNL